MYPKTTTNSQTNRLTNTINFINKHQSNGPNPNGKSSNEESESYAIHKTKLVN